MLRVLLESLTLHLQGLQSVNLHSNMCSQRGRSVACGKLCLSNNLCIMCKIEMDFDMLKIRQRWDDIFVIAVGVMLGLIFFAIAAFFTAAVWVKYIKWIEGVGY